MRTARVLSVGVILLATICPSPAQETAPVVSGYQRFRSEGLGEIEAGRLLISELNCLSCHGEFGGLSSHARVAPVLTDVSGRVTAKHLLSFLANPHAAKAGTTMPVIPQLTGASGEHNVEALTAFLTGGVNLRSGPVSTDSVRRGEQLFHSIGCAGCHGDQRVDPAKRIPEAVPLGRPELKYTVGSLITFLQNPHAVRPSGRMPSLNLTPEEARDVAGYLLKEIDVQPNINFEYFEGTWQSLPDFSTLTPKSKGGTTDFSVASAERNELFALRFTAWLHLAKAADYRFWLSSDDGSRLVIDDEEVIRHDGIHPAGFRDGRIHLEAGVHAVVVEYFEYHGEELLAVDIEGGGISRQPLAGLVTPTPEPVQASPSDPQVDPNLANEGARLFASLGCAACHQHGNGDQRLQWTGRAKQLPECDPNGGCLSTNPAETVPHFGLSQQQRNDIRAALKAEPNASKDEVRTVMLRLNCYACHERSQFGGVPARQ
ncbi:MAG: hypothetical protein KDA96_22980, partial [Planctomycetaceae bacterium]|nr:hypothetical protein [Planctomycetaceae bacterium]